MLIILVCVSSYNIVVTKGPPPSGAKHVKIVSHKDSHFGWISTLEECTKILENKAVSAIEEANKSFEGTIILAYNTSFAIGTDLACEAEIYTMKKLRFW